jgi:ABC-2 type transport system permease protein
MQSNSIDSIAPRPLLAAWTLCERELMRFFRQRQRVFGAIAQPIIFWILFGAGLGGTFRLGADGANAAGAAGPSFREYFFPGTLALILLFTAIFATISIIEDRREGFLQSVLVAPLPRWAMVLGKVLGGTLIALVQGLIFLVLALAFQIELSAAAVAAGVGVMFLVAWGLTSLGFVLAWRLDSTQGFHAIMSVLLMPMWLLSGAFFPAPSGEGIVERGVALLMTINPMTYGVAALRRVLVNDAAALPADLPSLGVSLAVTVAFAVLMFALSCRVSGQRTAGDYL